MKCFRRCSLLLLCLVMLSGVFSVPASAESVELPDYYVYVSAIGKNSNNTYINMGSIRFYPADGVYNQFYQSGYNITVPTYNTVYTVNLNYHVQETDNNTLLNSNGGRSTDIKISNVQARLDIGSTRMPLGDLYWTGQVKNITLNLTYLNDEVEAVKGSAFIRTDGFLDLTFNGVSLKNDVKAMRLNIEIGIDLTSYSSNRYDTYYQTTFAIAYGELLESDSAFSFDISAETKSESLLGGILDKIVSGFDEVSEWLDLFNKGLNNIIDGVTQLPSKIWNLIETGLKNLFVPSQDYLLDYSERMKEVIDNKFGAVAEVVDITYNSWEDISLSDVTDTITVPTVSISLPGNNEFTFGGNEVKIVPNGFEPIATVCKSIVAVVCTFTFINGMRKRYDEVMGVEQ